MLVVSQNGKVVAGFEENIWRLDYYDIILCSVRDNNLSVFASYSGTNEAENVFNDMIKKASQGQKVYYLKNRFI